ncbi:hypothetical protein J6590_013101, partial [Homalodisca vitripennis]
RTRKWITVYWIDFFTANALQVLSVCVVNMEETDTISLNGQNITVQLNDMCTAMYRTEYRAANPLCGLNYKHNPVRH